MNSQQMKEIVIRYKEQLPEPVKTLYDVLGFERLCELSELYGGDTLYIPKQMSMFTKCMQQSLVDEFNGSNQHDLSMKYGMSTRTVYKLVERNIRRPRNR